MTKRWFQKVTCRNCHERIDVEVPWKSWIRSNNMLDSREHCLTLLDCDMWVHRYGTRRGPREVDRSTQYLMLVEVKSRGADLDDAQRDTLIIVDDLANVARKDLRDRGRFVAGHAQNIREVYSHISGQYVQVLDYGVHKLRFNGATPANSDTITWDKKSITVDQLELLLRFDLNPYSHRPMEHRSHKLRTTEATLLDELNDDRKAG